MGKDTSTAANIFVDLAAELTQMPQRIQNLYEEITIKTVDEYFDRMEKELDRDGGKTLADKRVSYPPVYVPHQLYIRQTDWRSDIVDKHWGSEWGRKKNRAAGKRNFSIRPATYHDLAYIINYGHDGIAGTYFIKNATHRFAGWESARDTAFKRAINKMRGK